MTSRSLPVHLSFIAVTCLVQLFRQLPAQACSAPLPEPTTAWPSTGAVDVPPESSILVRAPRDGVTGMSLEANGQPVPLAGTDELGAGRANKYYRVRAALAPNTIYTLRAPFGGGTTELTRFTTGAAGSKVGVSAPKLNALRFWHVHHTNHASSAACVFTADEGYLDLQYQPGALDGTPPAEVVNLLTLTPKGGGAAQTFVFTGLEPKRFSITWGSIGKGVVDPSLEAFPSSIFAEWKPQLDPNREYCATLTLVGRNAMATPLATSDPICAPVTRLATDGQKAVPLPLDPGAGDGQNAVPLPSDGGCSLGVGRPGAPAALLVLVALVLRRRRSTCSSAR
jgi:hypothetical protein